MKFSIVTATYNSASHVANCLSSVAEQSYEAVEQIIIDGGSTDGTLEICKNSKNRVTQTISEPDQGIYDAMNKGIKMATGDVVGILNSDDFYASNDILEKIAYRLDSTGADSLYGNLDFVAAEDPGKVIRHWKSSTFVPGSFVKGWHPPHPTFFVRREVYERHGCFDISLDVSADFELMLRLLQKHQISTCYLDETIVKMRYGGESTGSLGKIIKGNKNVLKAFQKNGIKVSPFYTAHRLLSKVGQFIRK
jgi:glycosyltransferase